MTREEAIEYLKTFKLGKSYTIDAQGVYKEAVFMAIEALEKDPCEDAISRADVLDLCDSKDQEYRICHLKEDVECLSSVQPRRMKSRWVLVTDEFDDWVKTITCFHCGHEVEEEENFCPCCGCEMEDWTNETDD